MPPENASLHALVYKGEPYDWAAGEVEIGEKLQYHCFNGRKNALDIAFTFQEAGCASENVWLPPNKWENCTTSKTPSHCSEMNLCFCSRYCKIYFHIHQDVLPSMNLFLTRSQLLHRRAEQ